VVESMSTPKGMDLGATIISSWVKEMPLIRLLPNDRVIKSDVKWHSVTPQSCVLLEKPSVSRILRNSLTFLRSPRVHYSVHKSPTLVLIPSQIIPVHTTISYLRYILILSCHLFLGLHSDLFLSGFSIKIYILACYMPRKSHTPWLDHSNYTWQMEYVMKLLIM
jgi:hypothetical protein